MKRNIALLLLATSLVSTVTLANVTSLRGNQEIADLNQIDPMKMVPKNQNKFALNYVNQPPLIPHGIDGYQVNQSNNTCLDCHDIDTYRKTGAPRVSPTHFMDRENRLLSQVSARRYFCVQCHVPQANAEPIVANDFKPTGKFGQ